MQQHGPATISCIVNKQIGVNDSE